MAFHRRLVADLDDAQESVRITVTLLGVYGFATGLVALFGNRQRFASDSFLVLATPPGGLVLWGLIILTSALATLFASWRGLNRLAAGSLLVGGLWNMMMAVGFLTAVTRSTEASVYAVLASLFIATLHLQKCWLLWAGRNAKLVYIPVILAQIRAAQNSEDDSA